MTSPRALENITVLDLSRVVAGPFSGSILGDLGANVIKIETPGKGDDARAYAPHVNGESAYYANLNRNKRGITLNLKHPKGKQISCDLVKKADVVLENYRPGVMDRLGLGYDTLKNINPQIVYAALSGFGSYGPYSQRPGYDIISQAMGGLMSITGQKGDMPTRAGCAMGDILGGLNLTVGILAALQARQTLGHGQRVDVSLVDSVVSSLENAFIRYFHNRHIPERNGNAYMAIAPYNSYRAKDGYVIIACGNQHLYEKLCNDVLNMPEMITDERFTTIPLRVKNNDIQTAYIERWTTQRTVKEIVEIVLGNGIPAAPIYDIGQIVEDEHIAGAREMFIDVTHPVIGPMKVNGNPIKLLDTMPEVRCPAPTLGQHNQEILHEMLGMTEADVQALAAEGVL